MTCVAREARTPLTEAGVARPVNGNWPGAVGAVSRVVSFRTMPGWMTASPKTVDTSQVESKRPGWRKAQGGPVAEATGPPFHRSPASL